MSPSNYSFIDRYLAGSAQPYQIEDIEQYYADGVRHLVSLTPNKPLIVNYMDNRIQLHHLPVYGRPDDKQIQQFLEIMDEVIRKDEKAVVHCQFGQERTGMFLAAYLIERQNLPLGHAISKIKELRPSSLRTSVSLHFLTTRYG